FLTELDYGEDDGRPEAEVARRLGKVELGNDGENAPSETLEAEGLASLKRWDAEKRLPLGWAFLQERVDRLGDDWRSFAAQVVERHSGETVVATTSNGIARFATALLPSGAPIPEKLKLATGAFGVFVWNGETWRLDAWNVR
ncbi:MAG: histidine phosphatase family protein, partial [Thermoguttaceae bacterium]|nr:histidine phosphatase family protein [Thermoguttaceae bacterium]